MARPITSDRHSRPAFRPADGIAFFLLVILVGLAGLGTVLALDGRPDRGAPIAQAPQVVDQLILVRGDQQTGAPSTTLDVPLVVRALREGRVVVGVEVRFKVQEGGGLVAPAAALTDGLGLAETRCTLGPREGKNSIAAVVGDVSAVFTEYGVPGR